MNRFFDNRLKYVLFTMLFVLLFSSLCCLAEEVSAGEYIEKPQIVPFLTETYAGTDAHLRFLDDNSVRVQSYAGPGREYVSSGGYKPYKQLAITAYFRENDWVLTDIQYSSSEERFVYFPYSSFDSIGEIPDISDLPVFEGKTIRDVLPSWGPASRFNTVDTMAAPAGTPVKVFYQENGYVYGEYTYARGLARMWFPADALAITGAAVTFTDEPAKQTGHSSIGISPDAAVSVRTVAMDDWDCYNCGTPTLTLVDTVLGYLPEDEYCHTVTHYYEWHCTVCGDHFGELDYERNVELHEFGADNVCTKCGYKKAE